jgi:hypothetical protein
MITCVCEPRDLALVIPAKPGSILMWLFSAQAPNRIKMDPGFRRDDEQGVALYAAA